MAERVRAHPLRRSLRQPDDDPPTTLGEVVELVVRLERARLATLELLSLPSEATFLTPREREALTLSLAMIRRRVDQLRERHSLERVVIS